MDERDYALTQELSLEHGEAVERVRRVFIELGFGILYEIDMCKTLREKLGASFRPYTIMGICDPHLAREGLELEPDLGLLIPCNLVVQAGADGGPVTVKAIAATRSWRLFEDDALLAVAENAEIKIREALNQLAKE